MQTVHSLQTVRALARRSEDRCTANYCTDHVHGLNYHPYLDELCHLAEDIQDDVTALYAQHKTPDRPLVAFKGGMIERRWLTAWGIPNIDLEPLGCPKFDDLPRLTSVTLCGHHQDPLRHHCPKVECYHFVQWMRGQTGLKRDTSYVNHNRARWFLEATKPSPLRFLSLEPDVARRRQIRFYPERS